ncbi:hypothetical protein EV651_101426 [Kribbella sp. VKM Ac-2571]|nr:hypothetical protein EV651_101426 [Kribbella sp. VKM Ac-2571]
MTWCRLSAAASSGHDSASNSLTTAAEVSSGIYWFLSGWRRELE